MSLKSRPSLNVLLLAGLVFLAGCHTPAWKVASAENVYYDTLRTRITNCTAAPETRTLANSNPFQCLECRKALQEVYDDLEATREALGRGGDIKPQFDRVKHSLAVAKKVCSWAQSK